MKDKKIKGLVEKEAPTAIKEFDLAFNEFFKNEPKSDKEDKNQMEEFMHWYNLKFPKN